MKLEYPLNEALPNIDNARDRLLAKIFRFRKEEKDATDEDFELLYAYGKLLRKCKTPFLYVFVCVCADPTSPSSPRHRPALQRNYRRGQGD